METSGSRIKASGERGKKAPWTENLMGEVVGEYSKAQTKAENEHKTR